MTINRGTEALLISETGLSYVYTISITRQMIIRHVSKML